MLTIWNECFETYDGPFLFGKNADAGRRHVCPVCTRFVTYDVALEGRAAEYRDRIMSWAPMQQWIEEAKSEPIEIEELDIEF